ncbi:scabin-related ADP-ribosyltransferase [Catenulispora pinisilvae]|uniref:scabin-related ADP-ribosyltransferase n=1 Tax=Catenulispora pinisilvae TaxID=2705253 RepID=UPI0018927F79|nr:protein-glutamine glutaminase family protein [Catenulispora pinisilvae]
MGLDLPEPLRWVARIINMDSVYPQADEDQLGGLGDLWTGHQGQFLEFSSEVHGDTVDVTSAVNGPGIDMFQDTMNGLTGDSIPQIVQMMTAQSEASYGMAASVYESKISMILNTAELGVMLLYDRVVDAFFPGSGEALEEEQIPEAEITMLDIGKQLLGKVAMFGGQSAVNDALAQELTNVKFGTGFNWGEVGISAGIGALGGFFDGAITGGFMKFAPNLLKGTGWGNKLLVGGIGGVSNFASTLIGDVAQNQQIDWEQAVGALAGGTAMGLFGANHGGKGGGEGFHEEDFDEMNLAGDDFKPPVDEHFSPDLALQKVGADTNLLTFKEPPPIGGSHDDELDYLDVGSDDGSDFDADLHLDLHLDSPEIPPVSLPRIADFTGDSGSSPLPSDLGDLRSLVKNAPSDPGVKTLYLGNSGGRTPDAIVAKLNELVSNEKNFDAGKLFTPAGDNRIVLTDPVGRDGLDAVQDAVNDFAAKLPDLGPGATPPKLEVVVPVRGRDGEPGDWVVVRPSADQKSVGPVYDPRVVFFAGGGRVVLGRDQGFDVHPGGLAKAEIDPAELQALPEPVADLISTLKAGKPADPDLDKLSELARANDVNVVVLQDGEHPLHLNPDSDHQLYLLKDGKETSLLKRGPSAQDVAKTARASVAVRQDLVGKVRDRLPDLKDYKETVKKVQDAARASGVGARSLADFADVTHLYDLLSGKKESGLDLVLKAAEDAKPDPDLALLGQMVKAARGGSPKALDTLLAKVPDMRVKPSARRIAGFKEGLDQLADLQQINALRQRRRVAFDRLREDLGTVPDVSAKSLRTVSKREIEQLSGKPEIADGTGRGGRADYDHAAELLGLQRETFGAADPNRISQLAALHQLVALSRRELPGMLPEDRPLTLNDFRRLIHEVRGGRLDPKWRQDVAKVANLALRAHRQDEPLTLAALPVKLRYEDLAHDLRLKPQDLANLAERTGVPPEGDWRERVLDVQNLVRDMGLKDPGDQSLTHLAAVVDVVRRDLPRTAAAARGPLRAQHVDMVLDKVFGPKRTPDEDLTGLGKVIDDLTGHRDVTLASLRARAAFAAVEKHLGITHEDAARAFADAGVPTGRLDEFAVRERGVELLTLTHHLLGEGEFARLGPDGLAPTLVTARRLSDLLRSDHKESAASVVGPLRAANFEPLLDRVLGPGPKNHDEGLRQLASLADAVGAREAEQNPSSTLDTGSLRFEHQWQQLPESVRGHVDTLTDGDAYTAVKTADQIIGGLTDAGPYDGLNRALDTLTLHKQVYEAAGPGYREQIGSLARILAVADLGPRDSALGLDDLNGFVRKLSGEENLTATPQTLKLLANAAGAIPRGRAGADTLARSFRYERLTTKFDADPVAASATVSALTKASGLSRGRVIEAADVVHAAGHSLDASSNGVTDRLKAADKLIALARSTSARTGDGPLGADALKPLLDQLVPNHETDAGAQRRLFQAALDNRGRLTVSKLHDGLAGRHAEGHQRSGPARDGQALHDEFASAISRNDRGDVVLTDRAEDRDAFEALPTFKNTRTVAAHVNAAAKTVRVGGKSLTYDEAARLVKHTLADDADATPVVLVACEGAEFAKVLSKELGRDVIAANGTVWQLPGHHVVAERGDSVPKQGKWWDKSAKPSATWSRYRDGREESGLGESELSDALAEADKGFSALPAGDKDISGPAYKWTGSRESHAGALSDDDRPPSSAFQLDDTSYVPFEPDLPPSALTLGNCFHHALAASLGELDIHGIGPDPAKVPAWRHSVADRLRQSATGSDHSGETPLTIGSEESPTSRRSAQVLLSELSDDRLQELSRLHLDSTTVTRPSDVPPDSASAPRTAKNIHLERLTDLLDNGTLHERTSLLRSLSDRYTDDGKDGMAALAEYARTDTESGKGLPSYSSMLEFAQRLPSLWDSPLGDDLPESVAVLLDLHITVVRSDHTATSLNPDGATEVTLFLDTSGPRPHYQAVRSLDQHDGAPTVTRSPGGSDEQLRGAGFSSKLRGLLPSALKGGYRDLIKDTRKDLTDVLPEDEWWRLYIDPKDHEKALASLNLADAKARGVTGPGDYYDRVDPENKTKQLPEGAYPFRDGMAEALRELSKLPGVDFDSYKKLHSLAISKLADRQFQEKSSVLGRHEADNANKTSFSAWVSDPAADAESERYLNRPLLAPRTSANDAMAIFATKLPESLKVTQKLIREIGKDESDLPICTYSKEKAGAGTSLKIDVNYTLAARRPLYEAIMREYLRGIRDSAGESDRLRAIGKAVRALHVAHFFPDGNGRTHLSLLLQKLLLDNGFGVAVLPAAAPEGAVGQDAERTFFKLFNGGASLDTIVDELRSSIARTAEFHGPQTEASHPNAHVQTLDASGSHHPVAGPSNAHVGNPHVVPGVDHLSEHAHLLLEQSGHLVFPSHADDQAAFTALPRFDGHRTVAAHIDKATGTVKLDSETQSLTYEQAAGILIDRLGPGEEPIVLVGCDGADFAAVLSRLTGRDVIAADGTVWQLPGHTVVTSHTTTPPPAHRFWSNEIRPADEPTWSRYRNGERVFDSDTEDLAEAMAKLAPSARRSVGETDIASAHRWLPPTGTKHPGVPDRVSDLAAGNRDRVATNAEVKNLADQIGVGHQDRLGGLVLTAEDRNARLTHVGGLADVLRPSAELDIDRATQARRLYDLIRKNGLGPDDSGAFDPHQALAGLAELVHPGRHDGPITTGEGQQLLHAVQRAASASDDVDLSAVRDFYGNGPKVTSDVAQDLFSRLSRETYKDSDDGNRPIPFDYPEDGCYDRAHVLAEKLTEWGYAPRKVFAVRSGGQKLTVSAETAVGGFWGDPKEVTWGYHVATIVEGLDENGLRTEYVFDPSLHKGLLTVDEWGAVMKVEPGGSRRVDFPDGPDPRAKLPDSAGENAGHEVTLTAMRTVANEIGSLPDIDSSLRRSDGGANSESFNWAVEKPFILTAPKDTYWLSLDEPEPPAASLDEYSVLTETQHLANYIKALRRFYFEDAPIEKAVLGELGANPAFKVLRDSVSQEEGFTPKGEAFRHRKDSMLFNRVVRKHQDGPSDAGSGADDRWKPEFTPGSLKSTQADHSTLFLAVRSSDGRVVWLGGGKESDSALRTAFENVKVPAGQVAVILPGHGEFVQAEDRKQAVENVVGLLTKAGVTPDTKLTLLMSEAAENAQAVKAGRIVAVKDGEIKVVMKNGVPDRQDSFAAQLAKVWDGSVTAPNSSVFVNLRNGQVRAVTVAHDAGDALQPKVNGAFITFDKANPNGRVSDESWHGFEPSDRDDVWVRPPTDSIASTDLLSSVTTYSWGSSKQDAAHEARIGGYLLAKQSSLTAARDMVVKLRTTLRNLNPGVDHAVLDKAFFQDDVTGSGQVGPTVRLDDLLRDGNTRELMTAFYNGAYFSRGEHTFLTTMLRRDNLGHQWLLKTAGRVDVDKLGAYRQHIREATPDAAAGSASLAAQAIQFTESGHLANHFGGLATSTALTPKTEAAADLLRSAGFRDKRPDPAKALFRMTQVDLKGYGVGLGKYELAHLLRTHPELGDDEKEPLPWITGQLWSEVKTGTDWYQKVVTDGRMPVLSGPSGTAARLYLLAKLFDPAGDHEDFLGALTGWMLAGHDHSAYEIVQALRAVGYAKPGAHAFIKTSEDLYRAIPGLHADELHPNGYLQVPSGTDVAVTFKDSVHTTATGWSVTDRGDEFDTASALTMPAGWKSLAVHLDAETGHVLVKGRMLTDDQTLALFRPLVEKTLADGQGLALVACGGDKLAELLTKHYPDLDIASMNDLAVQYPDGRVVAGKLNGTAVVPTPKSWWNTQNETTHVPAVSHWSGGKKQHSYDRILGDALKKIKANSGPESETGPRSGPTASVRKPAAEPLTLTVDDETYTWTGFTGGSDRLVPSRFDLVDAAGIRRPLTLASAAEFLRNRGYTLTDEREAALNLYLHGTTKPGKDYKDSWFGAALLNRRIGKVLTAIRNLGTRYFDPARDNIFDQQVYRDARGQLLRIPDTEFSAPAHVLNDGASDRFDITEAQFDAHWRAFPPKVTQIPTTSVGFDRGPRDFKPELLPSARRYSPLLKASPLWYRDDDSPLYRWDLREPGAVFGTGFRPGNRDLARSLRYYVAQKHATGLISTTRTPDWIHTLDFAVRQDHRVYRYTIDAPGGIDVLSTLGTKSPFPNEYEVAFWDGIRPEFITGVQEGHIPFPGAAPVWGAWTDRQTWLSRHTSTLAPGTDVLSAVHDSLQWHDHEAYPGDAHIGGFTLVNGPEDLGMAAALPRLPGIVNIAVHGDPAIPGNYLLRGRSYTAAELAPVLAGYLAHPALAPYVHGVAVIGCNGAPLGEALSAAMFHGHGGWDVPVISTTGKVWQIAGGEVRASVPDHVPGTVSLPGATPWWAPGAGPTHAPQNVWTVHGGGVLSSDLGSELTGTYQHVLATYYPHVTDTARMSPFAGKALSLGPYSWSGPRSSKAHENALAVERQNGPEKLSVVRPGADLQKVLGIDSQGGNGFSPSSGLLAAAKKVLDGPPLHLDADSFGRFRDDLVKDLPGLDRTPFHDATTGLPKSVTFSGRKVSSIAADLTEETYQGRRLLASYDRASSILHEDLPSSGNTAAMFGARQSDLPVALVKDGVVRLNYSSGSGRVLLRTILDSYRLDVSRLSDHPYDQLRTIAKTVRALQVSGFFGGREGSVVRNVLLQKLLLDRGFGTAKLDPERPGEVSGSAQVLETNPWADNTRIDNPWADNAETAAPHLDPPLDPHLDPHLDPDELFSGSRPLDEIVDELVAGITRAGNSHQGSPEVQLLVARPETTLTVRQDRKLPDNPVLVYKDSGSSRTWRISDSAGGLFSTEKSAGAFQNHLALHWLTGGRDSSLPFSSLPSAVRAKMVSALMDLHEWQPGYDLAAQAKEAERALAWFDPRTLDSLDGYVPAHGDVIWLANDKFVGAARVVETGGPQGPMVEAFVPAGNRVAMTTWERFKADAANNFPGAKYVVGTDVDTALGSGYSELIHSSRQNLSDVLPEPEWWKLYINPKDHGLAEEVLHNPAWEGAGMSRPGDLYDVEKRVPKSERGRPPEANSGDVVPGRGQYPFRDSMESSYKKFLDSADGSQLGFGEYHQFHAETVKLMPRNKFTGFHKPSTVLHEPDEAKTQFPISGKPADDLENETYLGRHLIQRESADNNLSQLVSERDVTRHPDDPPLDDPYYRRSNLVPWGEYKQSELPITVHTDSNIYANYSLSAREPIYRAIMHEYVRGIKAATDDGAKLTAIAKAVRALHISHLYGDGNGRTHLSLLLQKLLLDNGFRVTVLPGTDIGGAGTFDSLFSGGYPLAAIVEAIKHGMVPPPPVPDRAENLAENLAEDLALVSTG